MRLVVIVSVGVVLLIAAYMAQHVREPLTASPPKERAPLRQASASAFGYRWFDLALSSDDQARHYQVRVAIPRQTPPQDGFAVLYMLDGQAVEPVLIEQGEKSLSAKDWPVLVTIGYAKDGANARVFDYTPEPKHKPDNRAGGAELFWRWLEQTLKPAVTKLVENHVVEGQQSGAKVALNPQRQTLWGHSFGGLFVLHTLFNHPDSFQSYIAADPSLWWQQGQILAAEAQYLQLNQRPPAQVLLQSSASRRESSVLSEAELRNMARRLSQLPELSVQYQDYFQHHHGSIRAASIPTALRLAQDKLD